MEIREFERRAKTFVQDGFRLPTSLQDVAWLDANTLMVSRDWGAGTMSTSSYLLVVKVVKRGLPLAQAREVFRSETPIGVTPKVCATPMAALAFRSWG